MKMVILDSYTLNPGDLDWSPLQKLGSCIIHEQTEADQIIERAAGVDVILTNKVTLDAATIEALPTLKYIGVLATGVNIVDLDAARKHNIIVTNVPGYGAHSVAR